MGGSVKEGRGKLDGGDIMPVRTAACEVGSRACNKLCFREISLLAFPQSDIRNLLMGQIVMRTRPAGWTSPALYILYSAP